MNGKFRGCGLDRWSILDLGFQPCNFDLFPTKLLLIFVHSGTKLIAYQMFVIRQARSTDKILVHNNVVSSPNWVNLISVFKTSIPLILYFYPF